MSNSIRIKVKKATEGYDLGASKFFGSPAIPGAWLNYFDADTIFFCQIRLSDIAHLDTENRLPHTGYLYIFIDTANGEFDLVPIVRYYDGEPDTCVDGFNEVVDEYGDFVEAWLMDFEEADESADHTHLFGVPSDWSYEDEPPRLLMQFDPLDSDMGFLDHLDGYLYFLFGKNVRDFSEIEIRTDFS